MIFFLIFTQTEEIIKFRNQIKFIKTRSLHFKPEEMEILVLTSVDIESLRFINNVHIMVILFKKKDKPPLTSRKRVRRYKKGMHGHPSLSLSDHYITSPRGIPGRRREGHHCDGERRWPPKKTSGNPRRFECKQTRLRLHSCHSPWEDANWIISQVRLFAMRYAFDEERVVMLCDNVRGCGFSWPWCFSMSCSDKCADFLVFVFRLCDVSEGKWVMFLAWEWWYFLNWLYCFTFPFAIR